VAENKTKPTKLSVTAFINSIDDKQKRADARKVATMMRKATGKSCLYVKRLTDIDEKVLQRLIVGSVKYMRMNYETK